jgi:nucleotide-binding universal stress UspA family protein
MQKPTKFVVQVDLDRGNEARTAYALALAKHFDASLEGVFATGLPYLPIVMDVGVGAQIVEAQTEALRQRASEAKAAFDSAAGGYAKTAWSVVEANWEEALVERSRAADIVVVGQTDRDDDASNAPHDLAADVLISSGRPVLTVPFIGAAAQAPRNILIAWKDSREAVRAVTDALPFMVGAEVTVLAANETADPKATSAAEIATWLEAHGLKAGHKEDIVKDIDVGSFLLSYIADHGVDLLVMGGYSRNRWRERILGGVTQEILGHMTVPVLMSH